MKYLHGQCYTLPITENLMKVLSAQDITQGGLGQQPRIGQDGYSMVIKTRWDRYGL